MTRRSFGWCLIGASAIARDSVAPAIAAQPDATVVSVISGDVNRACAAAHPFGARATDNLDEVLSATDVDAVYISSVNSSHYDQALRAIAAGKHVLAEKPLALAVGEARELVDAAKRAGVVLATNHHMRNSVPHQLMRDAVAAGDVGTPVAAVVQHAVRLPSAAQRWRTTDPSTGAGVALDLTVHDTDCLRFVLGQDPRTVQATFTDAIVTAPGIDETISGTALFGEDIHVSFLESFVVGAAPTRLDILGTEGALLGLGIQSMSPVGTLTYVRGTQHHPVDLGKREDLYVVGIRRFLAAVRGEGEPPASGTDGMWSVAFATAALRSARSGTRQSVEIDG
jgi:1,5-anhydro-D-fructose reductase (1,5-anhydro-D-mannitol-forming)